MTEHTESKCTTCEHSKICMFKQEFMCAQSAIDNLAVSLGDMEMKNLSNFDFIKPVNLDCVHYLAKKMSIKATSKERKL